jgi:lipooligosaccharide transport system ATP-binding protein
VAIAPIIEAQNLEKRFNSLIAVDRVSFTVEVGEVFGFLGPNGAGKTTTMRMIQCISPKTGGTLRVFGLDVDSHPREIKRQLGVVPQETNLDPEFTTYENLLLYSRYFGIPSDEAESRIQELLEFVHLKEKSDIKIEKLSGGMKRRLVLARALINRPRLLVLDEPTIGLDPQARHLIWDKLKLLQSLGNTIVLTTHYLEEAERLCDRLVIMDNGRILVEGSPASLVHEHAGSDVVEAENSPEIRACLEKLGLSFEQTGESVQVYTDRPRETTKAIVESCMVTNVLARRATLEDVFLKLTGRKLRE